MQDLNFQDPDKLFELIDTYEYSTQKNEIDGGNKDVGRLLGAMKDKMEQWRELNRAGYKFEKIVGLTWNSKVTEEDYEKPYDWE